MNSTTNISPEIACPSNPAIICPYRQYIVNQYPHRHANSDDPIEIGTAFERDDKIRGFRLAEHNVAARLLQCEGVIDGQCQTADRMSNSVPRTTAISLLKRLLTTKRGN